MKKFIYLLASCVLVSAFVITCEDSSLQQQEESDVLLTSRAKPDTKVDVCHYDKELGEYQHINISKNAVEKHLENHSDENGGDSVIDLVENDGDGDGIADCADCLPDDAIGGEKNTWYVDADGDGYGDPDSSIETCKTLDEANEFFAAKDEEDQKVFVDNNTDCDDTDPAVFEDCL